MTGVTLLVGPWRLQRRSGERQPLAAACSMNATNHHASQEMKREIAVRAEPPRDSLSGAALWCHDSSILERACVAINSK